MGPFYHSVGQAELIALNGFFIAVNIVIVGMQLHFTADIFLDQLYINLIQAVEIPVQCCIAAMRTQNNIIFHRINAFVFCTKILIRA